MERRFMVVEIQFQDPSSKFQVEGSRFSLGTWILELNHLFQALNFRINQ